MTPKECAKCNFIDKPFALSCGRCGAAFPMATSATGTPPSQPNPSIGQPPSLPPIPNPPVNLPPSQPNPSIGQPPSIPPIPNPPVNLPPSQPNPSIGQPPSLPPIPNPPVNLPPPPQAAPNQPPAAAKSSPQPSPSLQLPDRPPSQPVPPTPPSDVVATPQLSPALANKMPTNTNPANHQATSSSQPPTPPSGAAPQKQVPPPVTPPNKPPNLNPVGQPPNNQPPPLTPPPTYNPGINKSKAGGNKVLLIAILAGAAIIVLALVVGIFVIGLGKSNLAPLAQIGLQCSRADAEATTDVIIDADSNLSSDDFGAIKEALGKELYLCEGSVGDQLMSVEVYNVDSFEKVFNYRGRAVLSKQDVQPADFCTDSQHAEVLANWNDSVNEDVIVVDQLLLAPTSSTVQRLETALKNEGISYKNLGYNFCDSVDT